MQRFWRCLRHSCGGACTAVWRIFSWQHWQNQDTSSLHNLLHYYYQYQSVLIWWLHRPFFYYFSRFCNAVDEFVLNISVQIPAIHLPLSRWKKVGNLGSSFPGNLTIWREIMTFHIKKYTRHGWKCVGNATIFPGNLYFFPALMIPCVGSCQYLPPFLKQSITRS